MIYDVEHITKCMIEYDTGVPMSVIIAIFLIVCGLIALFYQNDTDGIKIIRNVSWCIGGDIYFSSYVAPSCLGTKQKKLIAF